MPEFPKISNTLFEELVKGLNCLGPSHLTKIMIFMQKLIRIVLLKINTIIFWEAAVLMKLLIVLKY